MPTNTLIEVVVRVTRDPMMKPSTTVYEHEVPLLEAIHGEDSVEVIERYAVHMPANFTVEDEWERLRMKYARRPKPGKPDVMRGTFRNGPKDLANLLGLGLSGVVTKRHQTESVQKSHDPRRVSNERVDTTAPVAVRANADGTAPANIDVIVDKAAVSPRSKDLGPPVEGDVVRKVNTKATRPTGKLVKAKPKAK